MQPISSHSYIDKLKDRSKSARVTKQFQLIGIEIAVALKDLGHKALYIKYAKELGADQMLALAKDVSSRRDVKNPAAYFMKLVKERRARR